MSETATNQKQIKCTACGATMSFAPGQDSLSCPQCGEKVKIQGKGSVEELDFKKFLNQQVDTAPVKEISTVTCGGCGAVTSLDPNISSTKCAFCGTPLVVQSGATSKVFTPKAVLPFKITAAESGALYKKWLKGLWFAPSGLKKYAQEKTSITGMYIPYWTFDAQADASYSGQRGDDYHHEESYTDNEGKSQSRTVTETRWSGVSGNVTETFDDLLVIASKSLPLKQTEALEPWDLDQLVPFDDKFLTGFITENYQVDPVAGFDSARDYMEDELRSLAMKDIGGDHQQVSSLNAQYHDITFKHILLPIWINTYRYKEKVYRFVINGRTGEVQGERPWSWIKITFAVLAGIAAAAAVYFISQGGL